MRIVMTNRLYSLLLLALSAFSLAACSDDEDGGGLQGGPNANMNVATTDPAVLRLEFPRLKGGDSKVIIYRTGSRKYDQDRVNYAVEWDCAKKSQRWSCYQMHQGYTGDYKRVTNNLYYNDTKNLASGEYYSTDYIKKSGYDHGHICPNADRQYSYDANYQTFYMTNMQPQYRKFNGYDDTGSDQGEGLWVRMEEQVREWVPRKQTDTLYVCKGGTIDNEDQIIERLQGKLIVPRYFFMAVLLKNEMGYRAVGFWAEQKKDAWRDDEPLSAYAVSIDELERLTGIDFFCNLPDNIENSVEDHYVPNVWGLA